MAASSNSCSCQMAKIPTLWCARLARRGFEALLDEAQPFADFMFERLGRDAALSGEAGKFEWPTRPLN